jgi:hypothetical protein
MSCRQVYDPSACCWQSLPDMRQPRYAHAVASLAGRVYALGGQASKAIHRWAAMSGCVCIVCAVFASCLMSSLAGRVYALGGQASKAIHSWVSLTLQCTGVGCAYADATACFRGAWHQLSTSTRAFD